MQQFNIRLKFVRCSCHRLRIVSGLQTMRTEVSRLIMKMVLTESCDHIILSHLLKQLKTRKYLLQVQVNNQHLNPFPLPSAQRGGEGVASCCYWQSQNHPRLVTSIVLLWASILQPASVTWNYSVLLVLFCLATWMTTIRFTESARGQNPSLFGIFRELWTESGSRSGWCKMLREGCEDKKLLLETEFTDCYSAVVSSRLRIKEIKLQQFVVTFLLTGVKP